MLMHAIRFKGRGWQDEQLAVRLWHVLLGDELTSRDQRVWRTAGRKDGSWSLSDNNWFLSCVEYNEDHRLITYELRHRYGFEEDEMRALAKALEMLLGVHVVEVVQ